MVLANITEIFSSLQGEGPHTGEATTFVRFAGCSLGCRWCDTETKLGTGSHFRVETPPRSREFVNYTNQISADELNKQLAFFTDPTISVTGGEPLEQAPFLKEWLPTIYGKQKILLETSGVLAGELESISRHIDIISMDIKLPSSTGREPCWQKHSAFIANALKSGKEFYIKIVVTEDTSNKDIQEAIKLISSANKFIPVVLQPVSETKTFCHGISKSQVESFARLCNSWLPNVSVMPQAHKEAGLL